MKRLIISFPNGEYGGVEDPADDESAPYQSEKPYSPTPRILKTRQSSSNRLAVYLISFGPRILRTRVSYCSTIFPPPNRFAARCAALLLRVLGFVSSHESLGPFWPPNLLDLNKTRS